MAFLKPPFLFLILWLALALCQAAAVETGGNGVFNTTAPTAADISNWDAGWGSGGITGWDYVGRVNAASGVYLGNGWVLTAAHVGAGSFTLDGTTYSYVSNSARSIITTDGTADLCLFQIASPPDLPSLSLATSTPVSSVVMLGLGDPAGVETWGENTIDSIFRLQLVSVSPGDSIPPWLSVDFATDYSATGGNLYLDDSGGGDFTYNSFTRQWALTGINEAVGSYSYQDSQTGQVVDVSASFMIAMSAYASRIDAITEASVPEPNTWLMLGAGALLLGVRNRELFTVRQRQRRSIP